MNLPPSNTITTGDCLAVMKMMPANSIDMILCDLPYGVTDAPWDRKINTIELWRQYRRLIKPAGAIVLTATSRFAVELINTAGKLYRYDLIWDKGKSTGFLNSQRAPLRAHESILVFSKRQPTYHPQKSVSTVPKRSTNRNRTTSTLYDLMDPRKVRKPWIDDGYRFPTSIIRIDAVACNRSQHATGKPVELGRYLINTYSNPGDLVLDNACGSGSFCLAALETGRRHLGIEIDPMVAEKARERILSAQTIETSLTGTV